MIFVTLGTFEMEFQRLLKEIESLDINEEIVIQSGYTSFTSNKNKVVKFMEKDEFKAILHKSDLVICHGGVGSILEAINSGKKVIAIPRLESYNEHVDDHQVEIVEKLTDAGCILSSRNEKDIAELIEKSKTFDFKSYYSDKRKIIEALDKNIQLILQENI